MVFFAGLPGTGKSLLIRDLAHLASRAGRASHLLQWDVARPVFEASEAGRRYPLVDGVTHVVIRKAVGWWARRALVAWECEVRRRRGAETSGETARKSAHAGPGEDFLVGETPFIGGRLVELARREDDDAEPLLSAASCRFVIPVPSRAVREFLEAERERRARRPLHAREREDAPPHVLRALWRDVARIAGDLGVTSSASGADTPYDPTAYRRVYEKVLRGRHVESISVETVLPTSQISVYDVKVPYRELTPAPGDVAALIADVEARYPDLATLERECDRWWEV
jgi:hypothetical protein